MYIDPIDVDVHWGGNDLINLLLCHGILPCYDGLLSASSCVFLISLLHPRAAFFWRDLLMILTQEISASEFQLLPKKTEHGKWLKTHWWRWP